MRMYDVIMKKRSGGKLAGEELRFLVEGITSGEIPDYQTSALLMAIYFNGLDGAELRAWTGAMIASGERLNLAGAVDAGTKAVTLTAAATRSGGTGRIETTIGPLKLPAGRHGVPVLNIGTLRPCSTCRTGTPAASSARSKVKLHPMRNATRSSRQYPLTSAGSATHSPCSHTR